MERLIRKVILTTTLATFTLVACEYTVEKEAKLPDEIQGADGLEIDIGGPLASQAVCNPLEDGGVQLYDHGLKGKLYALPTNQTAYTLEPYFTPQNEAPVDIYMNKLFVPTRAFDRGFTTLNGSTVVNSSGQMLYEWFALKMHSQLKLASTDEPGDYQLAILADDGAELKLLNDAGQMEPIISHPNHTSTKMMCAGQVISMSRTTRLPLELKYFQGPRHHIALILMWRKITSTSPAVLKDSLCGKEGNDLYFDSSKDPSEPKTAYKQLLARGWKPLQEQNFRLPLESSRNPCVNQPAPGGSGEGPGGTTPPTTPTTPGTGNPTTPGGSGEGPGTVPNPGGTVTVPGGSEGPGPGVGEPPPPPGVLD